MLIVYFLLLVVSIVSVRSELPNFSDVAYKEFLRERMTVLQPESIFKNFFENGPKDHKLNEKCEKDLRQFQEDLKMQQPWALTMLDASSTISSGLLKGKLIDLGMFDECLEINTNQNEGIKGRHCMYTIGSKKPPKYEFPIHLSMSICLPTSCNKDEVMALVEARIQRNDTMKEFKVLSSSCTSTETRIKGTSFWISLGFLVICISFVTLCTLCDLFNRWFGVDEENTGNLCKFSIFNTAQKVLSTETQDGDIRSLHGIRVLSTAWIILLHEYFVSSFGSNINFMDIVEKWFGTWMSVLPIVGVNSVDSFFVLSGFLMTYTFFKKKQGREESFYFLYHYIHRYLRLTLAVAMMVVSNFLILAYPFSGALYEWMESIFFTGTRTKWWSFITYTQNFVEPDNRSLQHLWFLAVDMQLYFISPLILYPLYKKPKIGLTILVVLIFASIASNAAIIGFNQYSAIYFNRATNIQRILDEFDSIYQMPHTRASPWLIGIALAYKIIFDQKKPTKLDVFAGWLLTIFCFGFCIFGAKSFMGMDYEYNLTWEIIYAAFAKPLWAIAVCWIIYASYHDYAGPISKLLCWKGFIPLSKLCFSAYLVHLIFPFLRYATARTESYYADYIIIHSYIADLALSIVLAFFFSIMFEIPSQVMDSLIFKKKKSK